MKFTIGRRIGLGFATLIVLTSIAFILTVLNFLVKLITNLKIGHEYNLLL